MPPKRGRPIALKILILLAVPLISLAGLWGFAAGLTGGDGLRLLEINNLVTNLATPSEQVNAELQQERLLTMEFLTGQPKEQELAAQRARTDRAVTAFFLRSGAQKNLSPELTAALDTLRRELDGLALLRGEVNEREATPLKAIGGYNRMVDAGFRMYDRLILVPDMTLYRQARAVTMLGEAKELLSRERALIVVTMAAGKVGDAERAMFLEAISTRRLLFDQALSHLDDALGAPYERLAASPEYRRFAEAEDAIHGQAAKNGLPATAAGWSSATADVWRMVERNQLLAVEGLVERVNPAAAGILVKIGIAGGLGLLAVLASVLLSLRFRRKLVRELAGLRDMAMALAHAGLPALLRTLKENPRARPEVTPLDVRTETTEVTDIVHAFNTVQTTAAETAMGQARLRHGVNEVFVNLARRNQSLLHRQLIQLDEMEKGADDPETLEDLFRLDHLTTRMRRHAESLIILSERTPGRGWRRAVPVIDVLRAASAEVEEYARVELAMPPRVSLTGGAVADVIHLLAELIENATLFSPPTTRVDMRATSVPGGLLIEIEDRGLGLGQSELDELNARLAEPPEFDLAESDRLGLFVVGKLAARHDVRVTLGPSPYGGLTATVLLPSSVIADQLTVVGGK
ncbi:nitrate- and nitrite sensing domain-containing protein [Nonomuraea sp. NPDC050310]|uniref:sensor histidine kinase n=1 Tax=Nonomuraea sp. NPDC050310 TaxID=3154935 RepID=UPI0033E353AD